MVFAANKVFLWLNINTCLYKKDHQYDFTDQDCAVTSTVPVTISESVPMSAAVVTPATAAKTIHDCMLVGLQIVGA